MVKYLNKIRKPNKNGSLSNKIRNSLLILLLGITLGILAKWLDNLSINDNIWWQHLIGVTDLRNILSDFGIWILLGIMISVFSKTPTRASINVFLFFIGMTISYHVYTIYFSGFNPFSYMKIWYGITIISPLFAYLCWYSKGNNIISIFLSSVILSIMLLCSFSIGLVYFYFKSFIDTLIFISTMIILYTSFKNSIISLSCAFVVAFIIRIFI